MRRWGSLAPGLCAALLAGSFAGSIGLGCGSTEGPEEDEAVRAARPTFRLAPARLPEAAATREPDVALFLPFVNRTDRRIHPTWVRSFDRTLAVFSAVFLDLRPVDPELAAALGRSAGLPAPDQVASQASPTPETLRAAARRAGAGLVIWGELLPGRRVALHARALVPGADSAVWSLDPIELEGSRDTAWYDGPRQLLAALLRSPEARERLGARSRPEPGAAARTVLAGAVSEAESGDLVRMRRAEHTLADLAVAQPRWGLPWLELFSLRVRRGGSLAEGPGPARHIAHLVHQGPDDEARLEALDWSFVGHERAVPDLDLLLARLPKNGWDRVRLARDASKLDPERFGLGGVEPSTGTERARLALAEAALLDEGREAVKQLAAELPEEELWRSSFIVGVFLGEARDRGQWSTQSALHAVRARLRAVEGLEVLRGACRQLDAADRHPCQAPLARMVADRVHGFSVADVDDDVAWDGALDAWRATEPEAPTSSFVPVPEDALFAENPGFAARWIASGALVQAANRSLAARDAATRGLPRAHALVVSPARTRLRKALDPMIYAAYWHAELRALRGHHPEARLVLDALQPFSSFRTARFLHAFIREKNDFKEAAALAYTELAREDPWDTRWLGRWLDYVDYKERVGWDDSSTAAEAAWLETLVPRNFTIASRIIATWRDAERDDRAFRTLEAYERQRSFPVFALTRDDLLAAARRPVAERLATLEAGRRARPRDAAITKRLVSLLIRVRRYADAERTVRTLLERPSHFEYACRQLTNLAARQRQAERGGETLAWCAEEAPHAWAAARLWNRYGDGLQDRDRFEEALEAYGNAYDQVGGAGWVVDRLGYTHVLLGDYAKAREHYEWIKERYGNGEEDAADGRWGLYWLELREKQPAKARQEVLKVVEHARHNEGKWNLLGKTYVQEGRLDEFLELCRGRKGKGPRLSLVHYHTELGEYDEALRIFDAVIAEQPKGTGGHGRRADILLEAGRPEEALAEAERLLATDAGSTWGTGLAVEALLALGRVAEARERAEAYAAHEGDVDSALELLAKVARHEGDLDRARRLMNRSRETFAWGSYGWSAEADWLVFEVSLGLPPRGSRELADLERRIERGLLRKFARPALWQALAEVREHAGDGEGASEARAEADLLAARRSEPQRVAQQ